jgi:O-antigen/teichoic acid export membrane protein
MSRSPSILKTTVAYTFSSFNQLLIQIITVPVFVLKTDFATYASWLIAYNFALFTSILDFGQVTASQNSFQVLAQRNKQSEIKERTKYLNTFITLTFFSYFAVLCLLNEVLSLGLSMILIGIFIYVNLLQTVFGVLEAVIRAKGKATFGIYASNSLRLSEFLGIMVGLAFFSSSLLSIAICAAVLKTCIFLLILSAQRKHVTVLIFGILHFPSMRSSLKEGMPFLISKMSDWLIISGVVISLSSKISSTNLVLFVASRTFFRVGWQLSSVVSSSFSLAIATAWAEKNSLKIKALRNMNMRLTLGITSFGGLTYLTIGKPLFEAWVKNQIQLERNILLVGVAYSIVLSLSHAQKTVYNSINRNLFIAKVSLLSAALINIGIRYTELLNSLQLIYAMLIIIEILSIVNITIFGRTILDDLKKKPIKI